MKMKRNKKKTDQRKVIEIPSEKNKLFPATR